MILFFFICNCGCTMTDEQQQKQHNNTWTTTTITRKTSIHILVIENWAIYVYWSFPCSCWCCWCVIVLLKKKQHDTWNITIMRTWKYKFTYIFCSMINNWLCVYLVVVLDFVVTHLILLLQNKITHERCQKAVLHQVSLTLAIRCTQLRCLMRKVVLHI